MPICERSSSPAKPRLHAGASNGAGVPFASAERLGVCPLGQVIRLNLLCLVEFASCWQLPACGQRVRQGCSTLRKVEQLQLFLWGPTKDLACGFDALMAGTAQQVECPGAKLSKGFWGMANATGILTHGNVANVMQ